MRAIEVNKGYSWTILLIAQVVMLFFILNVGVAYWDVFFLIGLLLFMVGGVLLLLENGVFNFFFYSFRKFLQISSKVERFVSEVNRESNYKGQPLKKSSFTLFILLTGIVIIIVSTIFPYYLF
ncbi:DUF3899 domain-containing protein [Psychrobacillus sp. FSL H8-0483]|uniref:DUF3899 domain-containing protein n=1 Tax=Psychrobacillus sp. FSL H8-0483 TaxID=2921389 RepID=UPI00315A8363